MDCTLASEPPARISVAICCCGMEGSEKNVMRWRAQRAAHVHAGGDVREFLLRAQVDARVVDGAIVEDEPAVLDVQPPTQRHELAFDDIEFALAAGDLPSSVRTVMLPPSLAVEAEGVDVHLVAQHQLEVAGHDPALHRVDGRRADQHLVAGGQHGIGQVGGRQPRVGNEHFAGGLDAPAGEPEIKARRGFDPAFGNIHQRAVVRPRHAACQRARDCATRGCH